MKSRLADRRRQEKNFPDGRTRAGPGEISMDFTRTGEHTLRRQFENSSLKLSLSRTYAPDKLSLEQRAGRH